MIRFALERPLIVAIAIAIVTLLGLVAAQRVPVQMTPDLDARLVTVRTLWPGAAPQDVENEIVIEQEKWLRNIPSLERMSARVQTGFAEIQLEFPFGTDIDSALIRVNNALAQVPAYPENVDQPAIYTSTLSDTSFMYFRIVPVSGAMTPSEMTMLRDFIDDHVRIEIERVPGVSEANLFSGAERQIQLHVDPARLAERGISIAELRDALRARNRDVSGGDVDSGKRRYLIRTVGRFESIDDIEDLIIARRDGANVHLRDVGEVRLGHFELRNISYTNGLPNITLGVKREIGANVVAVRDAVMERVAELNAGVLARAGLKMELNSEDVQYIESAIDNVQANLMFGAVLTLLVLFVFLRSVPATLTGAIAIPICTIAAFVGLLLMERTINVISLAGIAFAIGMTVDNSVVVLENIYRHATLGKDRLQAALDGTREVWPAVLASTLTTVIVFLPVAFVREEAGQLYSDIGVGLSASILMSMIVAVSVIPALCSRYLTIAPGATGIPVTRYGRWFASVLDWLLARTGRQVAMVVAMLALSVLGVRTLPPPAEYLPEGEEQKVFAFMFSPAGYNIDEMHAQIKRVNAALVPQIDADGSAFDSGETPIPPLTYALGYAMPNMLLMIVEAREREHVEALIKALTDLYGQAPGMRAFATRGSIFQSNFGGTRSLNLDISGSDLPGLFAAARAVDARARGVFKGAQIRPEPSNLTLGQPLIEIRPDWERAAELGIPARDLGYTVWALTDGAFVDEFFLDDDKIDMFIHGVGSGQRNIGELDQLLIHVPNGNVVPLGAIAELRQTANTEVIRRLDGERTISLSIVPPRDIPLERGVELVERDVIAAVRASGVIGDDIRIDLSGASDRLAATRAALSGNFVVAVALSYLLLVAIIGHWLYPLAILLTVPIGVSGGLFGLWLLNAVGAHLDLVGLAPLRQPLDMITLLGFLILVGTVVNNPILIVEQALINMRAHGMDGRAAISAATHARLRPIMMTTITTVFGLAPLVLNPGPGTELYRGLGTVVLAGLLCATFVTLTFMPALLALAFDTEAWIRRRRARTLPIPNESESDS